MILDELHSYFNAQTGLESLAIYKPGLEDGGGAPDFQMALRPTGGLTPVRSLDDDVGTIVDPIAIQHLLRSNPVGSSANVASAYQDAFEMLLLVYHSVYTFTHGPLILSGVTYEYAELQQYPTPLIEADDRGRRLFSFNAIYFRERE